MSTTIEPDVQLDASPNFTATRNACKLCAPLGACLAIRGIEGAVPFLHGSQGCATYIRRYVISHFREPLDVASSNFGEMTAIYGGRENLRIGLENVIRQYQPALVGIATTCLAETIGDDVKMFLTELRHQWADRELPPLVAVSTPSYRGTHAEGFWATVRAIVDTLAVAGPSHGGITLMPGMVSPADIRYLKEVGDDFGLVATILPDYSETLDGGVWREYQRIPPGGTPLAAVAATGSARATIAFTATADPQHTPAALLSQRFGVGRYEMPLPMGVIASDRFFGTLEELSGRRTPPRHAAERLRLIDAYVDAHKYVSGKRAVVYGEQDLVVGLVAFLGEIGVNTVLCASGGESGRLKAAIEQVAPDQAAKAVVLEGADFAEIEQQALTLKPDLIVGNSKGGKLARKLGVPLIRVGFPIHDRIDGPRLMLLGYRGAQQLFDRVVNALIAAAQDSSSVGYSYM